MSHLGHLLLRKVRGLELVRLMLVGRSALRRRLGRASRLQLPAGKRFGYSPQMTFPFATRVIRLGLLPLATSLFLAGCQLPPKNTQWDVPYTLQTFPTAYSERALEISDANKDGTVTLVEWTNAGGDRRSFLLADQNKDGVVTRTELMRVGSNVRVFDFTRTYADSNKDNQLTPREFRSGRQAQVLRIEF